MQAIAIPEEVCRRISSVDGLANDGEYASVSVQDTLNYMVGKYVNNVSQHVDLSDSVVCDCGAGYGWAAFAFLLMGAKHAVIVEPHPKRFRAAQDIAGTLGLADRCTFLNCCLHDIDLPDRSIDVFVSIETLEHVGKDNIGPSVTNIERLTKSAIVLTAPNKLVPLVSHDARVPFVHWLPIGLRPYVCRVLGKGNVDHSHFPAPWHLRPFCRRFRPTATVLTFKTFQDWRNHYPVYSPYHGGTWKEVPPVWLRVYLWMAAMLLGRRAYWACPNLANVWVAKDYKGRLSR